MSIVVLMKEKITGVFGGSFHGKKFLKALGEGDFKEVGKESGAAFKDVVQVGKDLVAGFKEGKKEDNQTII